MGIRNIYKEIGPGKRVSLTKLAVQKLEESGRPLRIAIDISIWQFQVQAARGGSNPAVRTLFYRLLRLLSLPIQPIFVFDGPNKPIFKRNKRSGRGDGVATAMAKRLIKLFGSVIHDAPGEAEAECALLQQKGIVDAVLSEDVDTIMFGCTRTLRNWSSEGKGNKTPTHVSMYDTRDLCQDESGLDREGMVLVALMSGGDYIPEGIPGAGIKVACEAARAGFGKSLCKLKRANTSELASWKEYLSYELRHNESGFFKTKHKALTLPEDFPNLEVLRYYTHPVVSPASTLERLKQENWDRTIDVQGLREFVRETFDWTYRIGAIKYIRVMAPCLLVRKFLQRSIEQSNARNDIEALRQEELELARSVKNWRAHMSTDSTPELRISFIPTEVVGYDFEQEPDEVIEFGRDGLALNSDDEMEDPIDETGKPKAKKTFSPTEADLLWVPETVARQGIPLLVETWEESQRKKAEARSKPKSRSKSTKTGGMEPGALDKFVKVTKSNVTKAKEPPCPTELPSSPVRAFIPPPILTPSPLRFPSSLSSSSSQKPQPARPSKPSTSKSRTGKKPVELGTKHNPWTIAGSHSSPRVTKPAPSSSSKPILLSSSPLPSPLKDALPPVRPVQTSARQEKPADYVDARLLRRRPAPLSKRPSAQTPPRKLSRTESLPLEPTPRHQTSGLARAQTLAYDSDSDSDSAVELPPLPCSKTTSASAAPTTTTDSINSRHLLRRRRPSPPTKPPPAQTPPRKLSRTESLPLEPTPRHRTSGLARAKTLASNSDSDSDSDYSLLFKPRPTNDTTAAKPRTTRLFMPSRAQPGFFREVEVSVEEADVATAATTTTTGTGTGTQRRRRGVWRQSDVSVVDLTGEV